MFDFISFVEHHINQRIEARRLLTWPDEIPNHVGLLAIASDPTHILEALDALETFYPGARVTVFTDQISCIDTGPNSSVFTFPQLNNIECLNYNDLSNNPVDWLILLHPWPYLDAHKSKSFKPLRRLFGACRNTRKYILFRNMSLWDGRFSSRLKKFILQKINTKFSRWVERHGADIINKYVEPCFNNPPAIENPNLCRHDRAFRIFSIPRKISFCPDCGMGLTALADVSVNGGLDSLYGPGYAINSRFIGQRFFYNYSEDCVRAVNGYLDRLNFDDTILPSNSRTVLDYGCGNGRYGLLWLRRGCHYHGLDPSPANIEFAQTIWGRHPEFQVNSSYQYQCGNLDTGADDHPAYGLIFLSHVLEHVPDPLALLGQLQRLTVPGGWLYIEVPNAARFTWSLVHRGYRCEEHLYDYTIPMLDKMVYASGWVDARSLDVGLIDHNCPYIALLASKPI